MVIGSTIEGMNVAVAVRRKTKITPMTSRPAIRSVNCTSNSERRMDWLRSILVSTSIDGGNCATSAGRISLMPSTTWIVFAPG